MSLIKGVVQLLQCTSVDAQKTVFHTPNYRYRYGDLIRTKRSPLFFSRNCMQATHILVHKNV